MTSTTALLSTLIIVAIQCEIVKCRARDRHAAYNGEHLQKTYGRTSDRHLYSENIQLHKLREPKIKENYAKEELQQEDRQTPKQQLYQSLVPDTPEDPGETQVSTRNFELEEPNSDELFKSSSLPRKRKTAKHKPQSGHSPNNVVRVEDSATYEEFAANYLKQLQDLGTKIETNFAPPNFIPDPRTHVVRNTPNKHGRDSFHSIQDIINSADDPNFHLYANDNYNLEPEIIVTNSANPGDGTRPYRTPRKRPDSVNSLSFQSTKPLRSSVLADTRNGNKITRCSGSGCGRRPVNGKRLVTGRSPRRGKGRRSNVIVTRTTQ